MSTEALRLYVINIVYLLLYHAQAVYGSYIIF